MSTPGQPPARLASEDVIISAPMSYAGSWQRIMRLRRRAAGGWQLAAIRTLAGCLVLVTWAFVTVWYLLWGLWLVPYRLLRRGARKRKAEAMRHRELMGTIQGSAAASAGAIVAAQAASYGAPPVHSPSERIADADGSGASRNSTTRCWRGGSPSTSSRRVSRRHTGPQRGRISMPSRQICRRSRRCSSRKTP